MADDQLSVVASDIASQINDVNRLRERMAGYRDTAEKYDGLAKEAEAEISALQASVRELAVQLRAELDKAVPIEDTDATRV